MRFEVLGPLRMRRGEEVVPVSGALRRSLLAVLLARANEPVPVDVLLDALWGEQADDGAVQRLQVHVHRLRAMLDDPERLSFGPDGYCLRATPGELDAHQFDAVLDHASGVATTNPRRCVELVRQALYLWRGTPYQGVDVPDLTGEIHRLSERRLLAMEDLHTAELRLGRHGEATGELTELAHRHPLRERLHALLMIALYRAGRQADALAVFQRTRRILVSELGLEPGPELREIEQRILAGEPIDLDRMGDAIAQRPAQLPHHVADFVGREAELAAADAVSSPTPRQLPAAPAPFVGRTDELATLDKALDTDTGSLVVAAISGTGGIGKSWLALRWAHHNAERFPDGQLYANLRGFDPAGDPLAPADVIRQFLDAFELPPERIPASLDAQAARYRSLLAGRRMLIVLDNARDTEQVLPLLPGSSGCLVLVTSRGQLSGLVARHNVTLVSLDTLSEPEAVSLLARRLGQDRVAAEPEAAAELIEHCARLPLALGIATARATANPGFSLHTLAEELSDEHERLDMLAADDPASDVRAVFSWSYQALSSRAARLFRLLGLHPGPDIGLHPAASLAGLDVAETRTLLAELARTHLLEEHVPGRYSSHDLLRVYAAERAAVEDAEARRAAVHRNLDHYLHTGFAAERHLAPHWEPIELAEPQPGVAVLGISNYAQAMRWFTAERANVLGAIELAARTGFDTHAWQLPWTLSTFLTRQGFRHLRATTQQTALAAAYRLGDRNAKANSHHLLGRGHAILEQFDEAVDHLQAALRHYEDLDDRTGQATVHFSLTQVYLQRERPAEALEHSGTALELYRASGNQVWEAFSRSALGGCKALLGEYRQSLADSHEALTLLRTLNNHDGQAHTLQSLGYAYLHLGEHAEAASYFSESIALFRALSDNYHEANTLRMLGDAHQAGGELDEAVATWERAVAIFDELAHPDADTVRVKLSEAVSDQHPSRTS